MTDPQGTDTAVFDAGGTMGNVGQAPASVLAARTNENARRRRCQIHATGGEAARCRARRRYERLPLGPSASFWR
ncbi:MAG: hypothetical protein ACRDV7_06205, partial [Acidimicrobiia bacterium]